MIPSVQAYFDSLHDRFVPAAAKGVDAVVQWDCTGPGGGQWHAVIRDGACAVHPGTHPSPTLTVTVSAEDYLKIINNQMNGRLAALRGKLRAAGSIPLAMKMQKFFPI